MVKDGGIQVYRVHIPMYVHIYVRQALRSQPKSTICCICTWTLLGVVWLSGLAAQNMSVESLGAASTMIPTSRQLGLSK